MVEVRVPQDVIDCAERESFAQETQLVLDSALRELRINREAGDIDAALGWWRGAMALNRAMGESGFIRYADSVEREVRVASLMATTFGRNAIVPQVDLDGIAERAIAALPVSYEQAAAEAPRWTELTSRDIMSLRDSKIIIKVLEQLAPHADLITRMPYWDEWRALREHLP